MKGFEVVVLAAVAAASAAVRGESFAVRGPASPKSWETTAVQELTDYLGRVALDGQVSVGGRSGVTFHVGDTAFARGQGLSPDALKDEEWVVRSFGKDVVLAGGGTRGTLYAVAHFLEDCCDVHWWWTDDEDVPAPKALVFDELNLRGRPRFRYRDIYTYGGAGTACDGRTAILNRLNRNGDTQIPVSLGGSFDYGGPAHVHTWDRYLPFARYGKDHPEWYSLRDGKRVGGHAEGQLCLTCPGLVDELAGRVIAQVGEDRSAATAAGRVAPKLYDLSMNDNLNYCQCPACTEEVKRLGHSGQQLRFANAVAKKVSDRYDGLWFTCLAYEYSEPVPSNGVVAAANVITKLCNTRANLATSIYDPDNRFMHDLVPQWGRFNRNLIIWEYELPFGRYAHGYPLPNEFHAFDNFRYYADNRVFGCFVEHEKFPDQEDLNELKFYLECRALENPYQGKTQLIRRFTDAYYGAAGWRILMARRYLDQIRRERKAFVSWNPTQTSFDWIREDDLKVLNELYDSAEAAVKGDARRERRVAKARAGLARLTEVRAPHPPEAGVSDRPFYDFPVDGGLFTSWDATNARFEKDPDFGGKTVAVLKDKAADGQPSLGYGLHDVTANRTVVASALSGTVTSDYRWYSFGRVTIPTGRYFFYYTRTWHLQLPISVPGMAGRELEMKALLRFGADEIRLARVAFVE